MKSKKDLILPALAFLVVILSLILKPSIAFPLAFASAVLLVLYFLFKN